MSSILHHTILVGFHVLEELGCRFWMQHHFQIKPKSLQQFCPNIRGNGVIIHLALQHKNPI